MATCVREVLRQGCLSPQEREGSALEDWSTLCQNTQPPLVPLKCLSPAPDPPAASPFSALPPASPNPCPSPELPGSALPQDSLAAPLGGEWLGFLPEN